MSDSFVWIATRSLAVTGYLAMSFSMWLGLSLSTGDPLGLKRRVSIKDLHRALSVVSLLTVAGHAAVLLFDRYVPFGLRDIFVPFVSDYRPFAVGLGVVGLYLLFALELSHVFSDALGRRAWRAIHFASFGLYVVSTFHGILAGSDSAKLPLQILYVVSPGITTFLIALRLFQRIARGAKRADSPVP